MTHARRGGWLGPVEAVLDAAARPVRMFFRDDDAGWSGDALSALIDDFARLGVPLDLAVIPAAVDAALAAELGRRCAGARGLLRLHQHGLSHANHETTGRKCEFGPGRSVADKRADIVRGRERLSEMVGAFVDPVFTPPWNRCDAETVALLAEVGCRVLSRDSTAHPVPLHGLSALPVSLDWSACARSGTLSGRLAEAVATNGAAGKPVGVMLHHADLVPDGRDRLRELLSFLVRHPNVRCASMMACVPAARPDA